MPTAYSFDCDLKFSDAVKRFDAMEDWVRKPNLDGRWLVRDNDRLGDYLSYYEYDAGDRTIVTQTILYPSVEARDAAIATGMQKGMDASFDGLDAYLKTIS